VPATVDPPGTTDGTFDGEYTLLVLEDVVPGDVVVPVEVVLPVVVP
jgi:hypothetical protein